MTPGIISYTLAAFSSRRGRVRWPLPFHILFLSFSGNFTFGLFRFSLSNPSDRERERERKRNGMSIFISIGFVVVPLSRRTGNSRRARASSATSSREWSCPAIDGNLNE